MLVDDNQDMVGVLSRMLKQEGFQVEVAHDGPAALELAEISSSEVVVLDLGLPGMDGFEVAQHLRAIAELNGLLLIAASGYDRESDRQRTGIGASTTIWPSPSTSTSCSP